MACVICGNDEHGGVYTNGDGYGDAKYCGVTAGEFQHFCWNHYEQAPDLTKQIDAAFAARGMCGFLKAWVGRCRNPKPCSEHQSEKCWKCGAAAIRQCSHTGVLVCGMPECAEHPHVHESLDTPSPAAADAQDRGKVDWGRLAAQIMPDEGFLQTVCLANSLRTTFEPLVKAAQFAVSRMPKRHSVTLRAALDKLPKVGDTHN